MSFINAKIIKAGASYDEYHKQDAKRGDKDYSMSRSELADFSLCPAKWIASAPADDSTDATKWGSMIDCLLTSESQFDALFAVAPETYPDSKTGEPKPFTMASNWCKAWAKEQGGKEIIKTDERLEAALAVRAIQKNDTTAELFAVSAKQVFALAFWKDKDTGILIPFRILIDLVPPKDHAEFGKWLCDFKTARNGDPAGWARVVDDQNYDWQAALYMDIYTAATKEDRTDFVHVVQENVAPYHVVTPLPAMTVEFLEWGRAKYRAALAKYAQCLATKEWPSYEPAGTLYGNTQLLGPDSLYSYRQTAGRVGIGQMQRTPYAQDQMPIDKGQGLH